MRNKIKCQLLICISILVLSCAFLVDACISMKICRAILIVSDDFLAAIFSGILTFSTLSLTVLSMVIGMMDTKISGLKLREILALDASPIKFSIYLVYSTSLSLLSIIALAFDLCTLMTAIAVCSLLYTTYASIKIFGLVSDPQICVDIILEEHWSGREHFINSYVYRWLDGYKSALHSNSLSELNHYSEMLKKCTADKVACALIQRHLPDLLNIACENMSFAEAVSWVFDNIDFTSQAETVCEAYIRRSQFFNADELLRFEIPEKIDSLINVGLSPHTPREINLCYFFFAALIDNETAGSIKLEVLDSCLGMVTAFPLIQDKNSTDSSVDLEYLKQNQNNAYLKKSSRIRKGIILRMFLEKVILNYNPIGEVVYNKLINYLYISGVHSNNTYWRETIACMYKYCYLLGNKSNCIDLEKKKRIISLVTEYDISLWVMVRNNITDILSYYVNCTINPDYICDIILDRVISAVDSIQFCKDEIGFAYKLYLASPIASISSGLEGLSLSEIPDYLRPYKNYSFPLIRYLHKMDVNLRRVCIEILKEFDSNDNITITNACMEDVLDLQRMNGQRNPTFESIYFHKEQTITPVFRAIYEAMYFVSQECSK